MQPGGLQSEIGQIDDALEALMARWRQTQESWRDANAAHVNDQYMEPLVELVKGALPAIAHLSDVIQGSVRAVRDPEDRVEY
jgi:hypothetical protein